MSTTDILLTDILNGLSPPSMLTDINKSIETLQGEISKLNTDLTGVIGKVTDSVGKLNTDLTKVIEESTKSITDALKPQEIDYAGLGISIGSLIIGIVGLGVSIASLCGEIKNNKTISKGANTPNFQLFQTVVNRLDLVTGKLNSATLRLFKLNCCNIGGGGIGKASRSRLNTTSKGKSGKRSVASSGFAMGGSMGISGIVGMASALDLIPNSMTPIISLLSMVNLSTLQVGLSSVVAGAQMAAAWIAGLGPIAWVVAAVVGVFALVAANIDYLQGIWGKFVSWFSTSFPNLSKVLEPVTNTITWILEKIKQFTSFSGGIVDKLLGKNSTDQVAPKKSSSFLGGLFNKEKQQELPSFVNPSNIAPVNIPTAIASNNTPRNGFNTSSSSQTTNHNQTVYNIGQIDIADGVIYEIQDFLASVRRRANTIRNASNIA